MGTTVLFRFGAMLPLAELSHVRIPIPSAPGPRAAGRIGEVYSEAVVRARESRDALSTIIDPLLFGLRP